MCFLLPSHPRAMKLNNGRMQWQSQGFKNIVGTILARGLGAGPHRRKASDSNANAVLLFVWEGAQMIVRLGRLNPYLWPIDDSNRRWGLLAMTPLQSDDASLSK